MGHHPVATNHKELVAWQLCAELRRLVLRYTRAGPARDDYRFRNDVRAAARSACYLTSEGFYRKRDGDFVNFLIMARSSLGEAGDQVDDGLECGYFTREQHAQMISFIKRACAANRRLREYLERCRQHRAESRPRSPQKQKRSRHERAT